MDRYFLVPDHALPCGRSELGECHYIALRNHGDAGIGYNVVLSVSITDIAPKEWAAWPSMQDPKTKLCEALSTQYQYLADVGLTGEETTREAVKILRQIHPRMRS